MRAGSNLGGCVLIETPQSRQPSEGSGRCHPSTGPDPPDAIGRQLRRDQTFSAFMKMFVFGKFLLPAFRFLPASSLQIPSISQLASCDANGRFVSNSSDRQGVLVIGTTTSLIRATRRLVL